MSQNCGCNNTTTPCVDCNDATLVALTYCDQGCLETINSDCVQYTGPDIVNDHVTIRNLDDLTTIIQELTNNANDVNVDITFNTTTRLLCLIKNGSPVRCVTISDQDDQYLVFTDDEHLQLWKPAGASGSAEDILISDIDLSALGAGNTFTLTSQSLSVVTNASGASVEIIPSSDAGNSMKLGSDKRPYVPTTIPGVLGVNIANSLCLTWSKTIVNGVISYTPTIDWACVAEQVCPLCSPSCSSPTNLNIETL